MLHQNQSASFFSTVDSVVAASLRSQSSGVSGYEKMLAKVTLASKKGAKLECGRAAQPRVNPDPAVAALPPA